MGKRVRSGSHLLDPAHTHVNEKITATGWLRAWTSVVTLSGSCAFFLKHEWGDWGGTGKSLQCGSQGQRPWGSTEICPQPESWLELTVQRLYREWELGCFCLCFRGGFPLPQLCSWHQFSEKMMEKQLHKNLTSPQPNHNCFQFFVFLSTCPHTLV